MSVERAQLGGAEASAAPRPRVTALALAVGLVLADSSIVVLALPEIYRELDTGVAGVTWVLISFNLVMAIAGDAKTIEPRLRALGLGSPTMVDVEALLATAK